MSFELCAVADSVGGITCMCGKSLRWGAPRCWTVDSTHHGQPLSVAAVLPASGFPCHMVMIQLTVWDVCGGAGVQGRLYLREGYHHRPDEAVGRCGRCCSTQLNSNMAGLSLAQAGAFQPTQ